jgi:hypothetical protein
MNMIRLYTGKDGQTHIEELDLATHPELTTMQATKGIVFRTTKPGHFSDWHNAPPVRHHVGRRSRDRSR